MHRWMPFLVGLWRSGGGGRHGVIVFRQGPHTARRDLVERVCERGPHLRGTGVQLPKPNPAQWNTVEMKAILAVDGDGQSLTDFQRCAEISGAEHRGIPCPLSLVVVCAEGQVLFGLNRWRKLWELPGGLLENGESPREAARRELSEETGVALPDEDVVWAGVATFELVDPPRTERAAVFRATLAYQPASARSHELTEVSWFRLDGLPTLHAPLDVAVAKIALE